VIDERPDARSASASERTTDMADMRKCIGSAKFGIEAHEAPVGDFPAQPSQKDGLGRMCKPHWNQYTSALRKAALARKAADDGAPSESAPAAAAAPKAVGGRRPRRLERRSLSRSDAGSARAPGGRSGGWLPGRRRIARPPPVGPRALGASPGPSLVGWRRWPCAQSSRHVGHPWRPWANLVG